MNKKRFTATPGAISNKCMKQAFERQDGSGNGGSALAFDELTE
jgi:hypothetical protein